MKYNCLCCFAPIGWRSSSPRCSQCSSLLMHSQWRWRPWWTTSTRAVRPASQSQRSDLPWLACRTTTRSWWQTTSSSLSECHNRHFWKWFLELLKIKWLKCTAHLFSRIHIFICRSLKCRLMFGTNLISYLQSHQWCARDDFTTVHCEEGLNFGSRQMQMIWSVFVHHLRILLSMVFDQWWHNLMSHFT